MKDITNSILTWVECSQTLFEKYFSTREDGVDEFINVERSLLETLVLSDLLKSGIPVDLDQFWDFIYVEYANSISDYRQFFVTQKQGSLFGESKMINLKKDSLHEVRCIDPTGTMTDGIPYVEIKYEQGFFLESLDNVKLLLKWKDETDERGRRVRSKAPIKIGGE